MMCKIGHFYEELSIFLYVICHQYDDLVLTFNTSPLGQQGLCWPVYWCHLLFMAARQTLDLDDDDDDEDEEDDNDDKEDDDASTSVTCCLWRHDRH